MVARLAGPPKEYWRVSYGERSGLSHEELLERAPAKFAAMLPGNPQPGDYEIAGFSPYRVHQRLAPSMRVGRIMLAADAAHLCNPLYVVALCHHHHNPLFNHHSLPVCLAQHEELRCAGKKKGRLGLTTAQ